MVNVSEFPERRNTRPRPVVELGLRAYDRLASFLEQEPEEGAARLGLTICPNCGDIHAVDELCVNLCQALGLEWARVD